MFHYIATAFPQYTLIHNTICPTTLYDEIKMMHPPIFGNLRKIPLYVLPIY